jgi:hypothetical protein
VGGERVSMLLALVTEQANLLAADLNRANGMSEIEGKATRVGASERRGSGEEAGTRPSFK